MLLPKRKSSSSWATAGGKTGICMPLEIWTKHQNFPENLTSAAQYPLIDLFLAMTLYLPLWHSHCTRQQGNCNSPEIFQMLGRSYHHYPPPSKIVQQHVTIILPNENISLLRPCAWVNGLFKINAYSGFFSHSVKLYLGLLSMQPCRNPSW